MSYVKHTWIDNETVTSAKLNNIEDGIEQAAQSGSSASVFINSEVNGSMYVSVFIYCDRAGNSNKSIVSSLDDPTTGIEMNGYCKKAARVIPLDLPEGYSIGIGFNEYTHVNCSIETSGGIVQSPVVGTERQSESSYSSVPYYIYEVTGSGTITVTST